MSLLRDLLITKGCAEGVHQFESMLLKTSPPTGEALETVEQTVVKQCYTSEAVARIVNSFAAKEYVVICKVCGKKPEGI